MLSQSVLRMNILSDLLKMPDSKCPNRNSSLFSYFYLSDYCLLGEFLVLVKVLVDFNLTGSKNSGFLRTPIMVFQYFWKSIWILWRFLPIFA